MNNTAEEKYFERDEVIFYEGETCNAIYIIVSGHVELSRRRSNGPVSVAILSVNDIFGETGFFEKSVYGVTARSMEKSCIKIVPVREFHYWLQTDDKFVRHVVGGLIERLRTAENSIVERNFNFHQKDQSSNSLLTEFSALLGRFRFLQPKRPAHGFLQPFGVGITTLNNDIDGGWTRALAGLLDGKLGILVRTLSTSLKNVTPIDQGQMITSTNTAKQILAKEKDLNVLLWGDIHSEGYSLCITPVFDGDEERPGNFSPYTRIEITSEHDKFNADFLYLTILAAIECKTGHQQSEQRDFLKMAIDAFPSVPASLPVTLNQEQQRSVLTCVGHGLATLVSLGAEDYLEKSLEAYRAAILRLGQDDQGIEAALLKKNAGLVLTSMGEKEKDIFFIEKAIDEFRQAVTCLERINFPQEWGLAQNRLGMALYRLDLLSGYSGLLTEAITALQSALQVFPRNESRQRWSDITHILAQVLQLYGDQMKSPEILERAVVICKSVIECRPKATMPMAWATCQVTLGTTLFLLGKYSNDIEAIDASGSSFAAALEVYREHGMAKQIAKAEKNIGYVERMKEHLSLRRTTKLTWADEE